MLMCRKHWLMVPATIQAEVWQHYRAGQGRPGGTPPSKEWVDAADRAADAVALVEGRCRSR
jgi:hypothetical protein